MIRCRLHPFWVILSLCLAPLASGQEKEDSSLTIVAIGDAGESGSNLRANAETMRTMLTGEHDGGKFGVLLFLGDNFYETGLNVPQDDVQGKIKGVLGPFRDIFESLGRPRVHAVTGNHDYYRRMALEKSLIFGLVNISELPYGLTDRGNRLESQINDWTYHYGMPVAAVYPLGVMSRDSVQLIFFDSPILVRTDPGTWRPWLDSLTRLLAASKARPGIAWRVLCTHNPLRSVGEHAGYSLWNDETKTVEYLTTCDKDSNAVDWLRNWLDPQDLCAERYKQYIDSARAALRRGGANIQMILSGHEHSMQLLWAPGSQNECPECPPVQVISGAGSRLKRVKLPHPPFEYTSADTSEEKQGMSVPGFVQLRFTPGGVRVVFFNGKAAQRMNMGGGKEEFWIDRQGRLVDPSH